MAYWNLSMGQLSWFPNNYFINILSWSVLKNYLWVLLRICFIYICVCELIEPCLPFTILLLIIFSTLSLSFLCYHFLLYIIANYSISFVKRSENKGRKEGKEERRGKGRPEGNAMWERLNGQKTHILDHQEQHYILETASVGV